MRESNKKSIELKDGTKVEISNMFMVSYRIICFFTFVFVYIGSVFMTYVILSDGIFQVVHFIVTAIELFEEEGDALTNWLKFIQQFCWVFYSFAIIAMIILIITKQVKSFFSTMWNSLETNEIISKISNILNNPDIKESHFIISMVLFVVYFIATIVGFSVDYITNGCVGTSGFFIILFFVPIVYGIIKLVIEAWRITFYILNDNYSKYSFKPLEPFPNFPFPIDLLDSAKLREQNEFLHFIMDERTNIYIRDGCYGKKLFGLLHFVALIIGICIRFYFMIYSEDPLEWLGLISCVFYLFCSPLLVFCNCMSPFLPDSAFNDDDDTKDCNFNKGNLHTIFNIVIVIYVIILFLLSGVSIFILKWERPEQKYDYKFFTDSSLMKYYWDLIKESPTTCQIDIDGITFTQLAALPMLTYFSNESGHDRSVDEHNIKVILNMALSGFKDGKVPEIYYDQLRDGIHIRDKKLHLFIIDGLRRAIDWVLLFEQFIRYYFTYALRLFIPFYDIVYNLFRVSLITATKFFTIATGCEFLTTIKAKRLYEDITMVSLKNRTQKWQKYTNIAVGHMTGGYFAKYLGTFKNPEISGAGFDSLSFQGTPLEIENGKELNLGMSLNVFSSKIFGKNEPNTKNNFQMHEYKTLFTIPDAVMNFCQAVAMCSNDRYELDFCDTIFDDWEDTMNSYGRYKHAVQDDENIGVVTNKEDFEF